MKQHLNRVAAEKFSHDMSFLKDVFKPRPRWVPKWLWAMGLSIYIRKGEMEYGWTPEEVRRENS